MAGQAKAIEIEAVPELARLVESVRRSRKPLRLQRKGEDVALLVPAEPARRRKKGSATSADDPIWQIVGMACSDGPGDVAENHDKYLADAYADFRR